MVFQLQWLNHCNITIPNCISNQDITFKTSRPWLSALQDALRALFVQDSANVKGGKKKEKLPECTQKGNEKGAGRSLLPGNGNWKVLLQQISPPGLAPAQSPNPPDFNK